MIVGTAAYCIFSLLYWFYVIGKYVSRAVRGNLKIIHLRYFARLFNRCLDGGNKKKRRTCTRRQRRRKQQDVRSNFFQNDRKQNAAYLASGGGPVEAVCDMATDDNLESNPSSENLVQGDAVVAEDDKTTKLSTEKCPTEFEVVCSKDTPSEKQNSEVLSVKASEKYVTCTATDKEEDIKAEIKQMEETKIGRKRYKKKAMKSPWIEWKKASVYKKEMKDRKISKVISQATVQLGASTTSKKVDGCQECLAESEVGGTHNASTDIQRGSVKISGGGPLTSGVCVSQVTVETPHKATEENTIVESVLQTANQRIWAVPVESAKEKDLGDEKHSEGSKVPSPMLSDDKGHCSLLAYYGITPHRQIKSTRHISASSPESHTLCTEWRVPVTYKKTLGHKRKRSQQSGLCSPPCNSTASSYASLPQKDLTSSELNVIIMGQNLKEQVTKDLDLLAECTIETPTVNDVSEISESGKPCQTDAVNIMSVITSLPANDLEDKRKDQSPSPYTSIETPAREIILTGDVCKLPQTGTVKTVEITKFLSNNTLEEQSTKNRDLCPDATFDQEEKNTMDEDLSLGTTIKAPTENVSRTDDFCTTPQTDTVNIISTITTVHGNTLEYQNTKDQDSSPETTETVRDKHISLTEIVCTTPQTYAVTITSILTSVCDNNMEEQNTKDQDLSPDPTIEKPIMGRLSETEDVFTPPQIDAVNITSVIPAVNANTLEDKDIKDQGTPPGTTTETPRDKQVSQTEDVCTTPQIDSVKVTSIITSVTDSYLDEQKTKDQNLSPDPTIKTPPKEIFGTEDVYTPPQTDFVKVTSIITSLSDNSLEQNTKGQDPSPETTTKTSASDGNLVKQDIKVKDSSPDPTIETPPMEVTETEDVNTPPHTDAVNFTSIITSVSDNDLEEQNTKDQDPFPETTSEIPRDEELSETEDICKPPQVDAVNFSFMMTSISDNNLQEQNTRDQDPSPVNTIETPAMEVPEAEHMYTTPVNDTVNISSSLKDNNNLEKQNTKDQDPYPETVTEIHTKEEMSETEDSWLPPQTDAHNITSFKTALSEDNLAEQPSRKQNSCAETHGEHICEDVSQPPQIHSFCITSTGTTTAERTLKHHGYVCKSVHTSPVVVLSLPFTSERNVAEQKAIEKDTTTPTFAPTTDAEAEVCLQTSKSISSPSLTNLADITSHVIKESEKCFEEHIIKEKGSSPEHSDKLSIVAFNDFKHTKTMCQPPQTDTADNPSDETTVTDQNTKAATDGVETGNENDRKGFEDVCKIPQANAADNIDEVTTMSENHLDRHTTVTMGQTICLGDHGECPAHNKLSNTCADVQTLSPPIRGGNTDIPKPPTVDEAPEKITSPSSVRDEELPISQNSPAFEESSPPARIDTPQTPSNNSQESEMDMQSEVQDVIEGTTATSNDSGLSKKQLKWLARRQRQKAKKQAAKEAEKANAQIGNTKPFKKTCASSGITAPRPTADEMPADADVRTSLYKPEPMDVKLTAQPSDNTDVSSDASGQNISAPSAGPHTENAPTPSECDSDQTTISLEERRSLAKIARSKRAKARKLAADEACQQTSKSVSSPSLTNLANITSHVIKESEKCFEEQIIKEKGSSPEHSDKLTIVAFNDFKHTKAMCQPPQTDTADNPSDETTVTDQNTKEHSFCTEAATDGVEPGNENDRKGFEDVCKIPQTNAADNIDEVTTMGQTICPGDQGESPAHNKLSNTCADVQTLSPPIRGGNTDIPKLPTVDEAPEKISSPSSVGDEELPISQNSPAFEESSPSARIDTPQTPSNNSQESEMDMQSEGTTATSSDSGLSKKQLKWLARRQRQKAKKRAAKEAEKANAQIRNTKPFKETCASSGITAPPPTADEMPTDADVRSSQYKPEPRDVELTAQLSDNTNVSSGSCGQNISSPSAGPLTENAPTPSECDSDQTTISLEERRRLAKIARRKRAKARKLAAKEAGMAKAQTGNTEAIQELHLSSASTASVPPTEMAPDSDFNTLQNENVPNNCDVIEVPKVPTDISVPGRSLISSPLEVSISSNSTKTDILSANNIADDPSSDKREVPLEVTTPGDPVDSSFVDLSTNSNSESTKINIWCEENILESMEFVSALATSVSHTNTQRDIIGHTSTQAADQSTYGASLNACSPSDCGSDQTVSSEERKRLPKIARRRRAKARKCAAKEVEIAEAEKEAVQESRPSLDTTSPVPPAEMITDSDVNTAHDQVVPKTTGATEPPSDFPGVATAISEPKVSSIGSESTKGDVLQETNTTEHPGLDRPEVPANIVRSDEPPQPFSSYLDPFFESTQFLYEGNVPALDSKEINSGLVISDSFTITQNVTAHGSSQQGNQGMSDVSLSSGNLLPTSVAASLSGCDSEQTISCKEKKRLAKIGRRKEAKTMKCAVKEVEKIRAEMAIAEAVNQSPLSSNIPAPALPDDKNSNSDANTLQVQPEFKKMDVPALPLYLPEVPIDISQPQVSSPSISLEVNSSTQHMVNYTSQSNIIDRLASDTPDVSHEVTKISHPTSVGLISPYEPRNDKPMAETNSEDFSVSSASANTESDTNTHSDATGHNSLQFCEQGFANDKLSTNGSSTSNASRPSVCDSDQAIAVEDKRRLAKLARRKRTKGGKLAAKQAEIARAEMAVTKATKRSHVSSGIMTTATPADIIPISDEPKVNNMEIPGPSKKSEPVKSVTQAVPDSTHSNKTSLTSDVPSSSRSGSNQTISSEEKRRLAKRERKKRARARKQGAQTAEKAATSNTWQATPSHNLEATPSSSEEITLNFDDDTEFKIDWEAEMAKQFYNSTKIYPPRVSIPKWAEWDFSKKYQQKTSETSND